jgi:ABC-2 type transport system permease protein
VSGLRRLAVPAGSAAHRLFADRGGLAVSVLFYLLVSTVLAALWRAATGPDGNVVGYTGAQLTWYAFTAEAAIGALSIRLIEEVGEEIGSGAVTVELLRPMPVLAVRLAVEYGRALVRLAALVVTGTALAWLVVGPPPSGAGAALAVPSLALAAAANLALQYTVAAGAFWLRDARAGWFLYQKLVFVVGGMLLPLEVLPDAVQPVAFALPFMAMAYAPARLAAGHVEPGLLLVQAGWVVVLVGLAAVVFTAGQRRVQVTG